jgi:polyisoprenoid-binding protein YceI
VATFRIVPERSRLSMDARSSLHPIRGESAGVEGTIEADASDGDAVVLVSARIEVAVEALKSGNPLYDTEIRRRVDSRRFPTMTGETEAVTPAGAPDRFKVVGGVTFHGVTERVDGEVQLTVEEDGLLRVEGERVFDVRAFGVQPPRIMMLRVHPEVRVGLSVVAEPVSD